MRIGINGRFYAAGVTGVQRFAREIAARICATADVVLLMPRSTDPPGELAGTVHTVRGRLDGHSWEQLELPRSARAAGCDVVLNLSGTAPVAGGPQVMTVHDVLPLTNPEWFSRAFSTWYRAVIPRAARAAAAIVTVSAESKWEIERVLRVNGERVHVVAQGLAPFDRPASREDCRDTLAALGIERPFLLAAGHGDPRKNIGFLTEVLRRWRERGVAPPLLVVTGVSRRRIHGAWPRADRSGGDVMPVGHVSDREMHALYTAASAFCFPSLAEGFGRPPLEAVGCGTRAVVAPFAGAVARFGEIARVLPLDPDIWADVLAKLVQVGGREAASAGPPVTSADLAARFSWDSAAVRVLDACRVAVDVGTGEAAIR